MLEINGRNTLSLQTNGNWTALLNKKMGQDKNKEKN